MATVDITLYCRNTNSTNKFMLHRMDARVPSPGQNLSYDIVIPEKTTVERFEVYDPISGKTLHGGPAQAFQNPGVYTIRLTSDLFPTPKPTRGERDERRRKSAREWRERKQGLRIWGPVAVQSRRPKA